jgi:phenylacetate-CoA ligase
MDDGAGELVLTHLAHQAAPLLRFRTRDHVSVRTGTCLRPHRAEGALHRPHRRHADRARRERVPSAVREVVNQFGHRSAATSWSCRRRG